MKDIIKKYSFTAVVNMHNEALAEREEWLTDWKAISEWLLPGRGIYQTYKRPQKRKLTTKKVINPIAEDALYVLTSGMHSGLTSPSRPWFKLSWGDERINNVEPLVAWLQGCEDRLHTALHSSNFYSIINSFYIEYCGFGTGCIFMGEDSETDRTPFRFELLTAGEYSFTTDATGLVNSFFRTIILSPRQLVERFPDTASKKMQEDVAQNKQGVDTKDITILEYVVRDNFMNKPFTRIIYELESGGTYGTHVDRGVETSGVTYGGVQQKPLEVKGFHEFPYLVARWGTIGSDTYGIGPGSRAVPHIRRLQEMEKVKLLASHMDAQPPTNVPARMRNKASLLPGAKNYSANPAEVITPIFPAGRNTTSLSQDIERCELRIQKNFFNDIFITAARDPNSSPLKAAQVNVQEQEKMLRLGPVIERLQHEGLQPLIDRCFNIMLRKGLFETLAPEYAEMAGDYNISMVSPLATAQRGVALNGVNSFLGFVGQAAQFDPTVMDNVDIDEATREFADITGVRLGILRPEKEVAKLRQQRQKQQQAEKRAQQQAEVAQMQSGVDLQDAQTRKASAEAGMINLEGQQVADDMGMF